MKSKLLEDKLKPLLNLPNFKGYSIDDLIGAYKLLLVLQVNDCALGKGKLRLTGNLRTMLPTLLAIYMTIVRQGLEEYAILTYASNVFYFKTRDKYKRLTLKDLRSKGIIAFTCKGINKANELDQHNRYISLPAIDCSLAILYGEHSVLPKELYGVKFSPYWTVQVGKELEGIVIPVALKYLTERQYEPPMVSEYLDAVCKEKGLSKSKLTPKELEQAKTLLEEAGR